MSDPLFDLASLAVHNDLDEPALERLLAAYFGDQPGDSRLAALHLMRLMVLAHEAVRALPQTEPSAEAGEQFQPLLRAAEDRRVDQWLRSAAA